MSQSRRDLSFNYTRRQFFPALLRELVVTASAARGRPTWSLSELGSLPDEQIVKVRPVMNPEYEIVVDQDHVWSWHKKTGVATQLFAMGKENLVAFNLFNGEHTLGEVARQIAQEMEWDEAASLAHVRELFLLLVSHLVCLPRDPLPEE